MVDAASSVFTILDTLGFSNYVIPFILIFAALYAVTMKIKLPSDRADLNGIISFAITYIFIAFGGGKMVNALLPAFIIIYLLLFIALLFYQFIGASSASIVKALTMPSMVFLVIAILIVFTFVSLQDWLSLNDRIPAWQVNSSGDLIVQDRIGGTYTGNITNTSFEDKPHSIIVNGQEYDLIQGIYYKQGYEGAAYALGQPQVIGGILILIILGVATAVMVWPK